MQIQVAHFAVHTPEQAREILTQAMQIADDTVFDGREWETVFVEACRLVGARVSVPVQPQVPAAADLGLLLRDRAG